MHTTTDGGRTKNQALLVRTLARPHIVIFFRRRRLFKNNSFNIFCEQNQKRVW